MTATQTQQPKALQLADRLKERIRQLNNSWNAKWNRSTEEFDLCAKSEDELRYQHAEIARLTAENRALRSAVSEAVAAEREACAKACESSANGFGEETPWAAGYVQGILDVASGIRARGTP